MTFAEAVTKSTGKLRVLAEADIAVLNIQWVNVGAGIYFASAVNLYPTVGTGANLGSAFTVQGWGAIGSVRVDGTPLVRVASLLLITSTATSFYYDSSIRGLYVRLINHDEPGLHIINIGVIYGYSAEEFSPINGPGVYEGRLTRNPTISISRDPLFYGRIVFRTGAFNLINSDGKFDSFGVDNDVFGNEARVKIGFDAIDYADYKTVFTGYIDNFSVSETGATFNITDKRKQLTKPIKRTSTAVNALDEIAAILLEAYGFAYDERFFDLTAWAAARAAIPTARSNVTLNMQKSAPVIDVIEDICASVFGQFRYNADNKFTFKIVDTTVTSAADIEATDILTTHAIRYDPSEVVSSVRVGYNRNWTTTGTQYTYYTDNDREDAVFGLYKTYNEKTFNTLLPTLTAATAFATVVLDYTDTVRGTETIIVPLEHYNRNLGDMVNVFVQRGDQPMLGYRKCEVVSTQLGYDTPTMQLGLRYVGKPLDSGLVVYYSFDADSSVDDSGNGNNGTDTDMSYETGLVGRAARFNGLTSRIALPSGVYSIIRPSLSWSIAMWLNVNTLDPAETFVRAFYVGAGTSEIEIVWNDTTNGWYVRLNDGVDTVLAFCSAVGIGEWHHIVVTHAATTVTIYQDAINEDDALTAVIDDFTPTVGSLGGVAAANNLDGLEDEVRIYDRALTPREIRYLYENPVP